MFSLSFSFLLSSFLLVRLASSYLNIIADCDETFNYWEPTHFMVFGYGLQTWEYSPLYALRSYAYTSLHALPAHLIDSLSGGNDKVLVFFCLRALLGAFCAWSEARFCQSIRKRLGEEVAWWTFAFLLVSPGVFLASTSYVPSSFSMCLMMLGMAGWLDGSPWHCVPYVSICVLLGWPFVCVAVLPIALHHLVTKPVKSFLAGAISAAAVMTFTLLVDHHYYHKWVSPTWNLLYYNRSTSHGSSLFGTEPFSFYFINGFLNLNVAFVLALLCPLLMLISLVAGNRLTPSLSIPLTALFISPFYVWLSLMLYPPHKEERFLFVVYPIICLAGAVSLGLAKGILLGTQSKKRDKSKKLHSFWSLITLIILITFLSLSASRIASTTINYSAPLSLYKDLYYRLQSESEGNAQDQVNICVGKEWYRFPSNFFLPSQKYNIKFVKSSFKGLLPAPYMKEESTWAIPPHFNQNNQEEESLYTDISECDYMIDFEVPNQEKRLTDDQDWRVIAQYPFLDANASPSLTRAFWIPSLSKKRNIYRSYYLFKRKSSP